MDLLFGEELGPRHLDVEARRDGGRGGVRRAPVAHDEAREVVRPLEHGAERVRVLARVLAVDQIVRAHVPRRPRRRRGERLAVQLHQRDLVDELVHRRAVVLLVVDEVVLRDRHHVLLDAVDDGHDERRAERRVLARDVLEGAAVAVDARDARARALLDVGALRPELLAHRHAPRLGEARVPGRRDVERRRPLRRRAARGGCRDG